MTEDIIRKKLRENVEEYFDKMHDFEKDTKDSLESSGSYFNNCRELFKISAEIKGISLEGIDLFCSDCEEEYENDN